MGDSLLLFYIMLWFLLGLMPSVTIVLHTLGSLQYNTVKDVITWGGLIFFFLFLPSNLVVMLTIFLVILVEVIGNLIKDEDSWFNKPIFE
jgi:hypothetical protein